ncbi:hypothetical protein [Clostridium sp. DJ247]|uniref:hypothetical protein n=1 Tax=Clostridium sp. DJ247 TaxID=2726188 RepID=UPI0016296D1C|nr:hypothetical protein [Clostridium sp. DJ247]MBC2580444.1 hypothetical protein [Clostridium sp. DJ247]
MNKIYLAIIKFLKILKRLMLSMIKYCDFFIERKKTIDSMYITIKQEKIKEFQVLNIELKDIQSKNSNLEKEVIDLKASIGKKRKLIGNLQDLITRRSD